MDEKGGSRRKRCVPGANCGQWVPCFEPVNENGEDMDTKNEQMAEGAAERSKNGKFPMVYDPGECEHCVTLACG